MKAENVYLTLEQAVRLNEQIENILWDLKDELNNRILDLETENPDIKWKIQYNIDWKFQEMIWDFMVERMEMAQTQQACVELNYIENKRLEGIEKH